MESREKGTDRSSSLRCPLEAKATTENSRSSSDASLLGSGVRWGPDRIPQASTRLSGYKITSYIFQVPLTPVSPCLLTRSHPSSGPLRTLEIPVNNILQEEQVGQLQPPPCVFLFLPLPEWEPWSFQRSPQAFWTGSLILLPKWLNSANFLEWGSPRPPGKAKLVAHIPGEPHRLLRGELLSKSTIPASTVLR